MSKEWKTLAKIKHSFLNMKKKIPTETFVCSSFMFLWMFTRIFTVIFVAITKTVARYENRKFNSASPESINSGRRIDKSTPKFFYLNLNILTNIFYKNQLYFSILIKKYKPCSLINLTSISGRTTFVITASLIVKPLSEIFGKTKRLNKTGNASETNPAI